MVIISYLFFQIWSLITDLFLLSLSDKHHNSALSFPSCAAHSLHQTDGTFVGIKTDDEVHITDIQTLFSHTSGHQGIVAAFSELLHYLQESEGRKLSKC